MKHTTHMDFKTLPKADLHGHLTGMLCADDLRKLAKNSLFNIDEYEPLENKVDFFNPQIWSIARQTISSPEGIADALYVVLKRQAKDGIKYSEIIVNFYKMVCEGLNLPNTIYKIEITLDRVFMEEGIKSRVRIGFNRADGPDALKQLYLLFNNVNNKYFCGFDINGMEIEYPIDPFLPILRQFSNHNIPFTVHAGELPENDNKLLEIINCNPVRIGHGLAFYKHPELIHRLIKKNISLEICPKINILTKVVPEISAHPVIKLIKMGTPIVICSDNNAMFKTTLSKEYQLLMRNGIKLTELSAIAKHSMDYSV